MDSNHLADRDEKLILDTPPHLIFLIVPILAVLILWVLYVFAVCPAIVFLDGACFLISGFAFVFPALALVLFLDWVNNRLILTNLKVTRIRGIIGKTIMTIELNRVQDIKVYFMILGRIFGFGTLEIESAGTFGKIVFRGIPSPVKIKNQIDKAIQNLSTAKENPI